MIMFWESHKKSSERNSVEVEMPESSFKTHLKKTVALLSIQSTSYARNPTDFQTHMLFPKELLHLVIENEGLIW